MHQKLRAQRRDQRIRGAFGGSGLRYPFVYKLVDLLSDRQGMDQRTTLADKRFFKNESSAYLPCLHRCGIEKLRIEFRGQCGGPGRSDAKTLRGYGFGTWYL